MWAPVHDDSDHHLSYDPRSWASAARPAIATTPRPPRSLPLDGVRPAIATAAGMVIAVAGGCAAWLSWPATTVLVPTRAVSVPTLDAAAERRTLVVASIDNLGDSLIRTGIVASDAAAAEAAAHTLRPIRGDVRLELVVVPAAAGTRLRRLVATGQDGSGVQLIAEQDGSFAGTTLAARLVRRLTFVRGELDGESFYSSAVAAGVADVLVGEFANAFRYDFDMQREVSPGDVFEAGYAQGFNARGEPVGVPTLVYAALSTGAKSRALYRSAGGEWFDAGGRSSLRALMRTPVEAARISSGFGMRGHPILGFAKMHRGTDFAAPTGTPIFAAGNATVTFAGPKGPNGNFVRLHHDNGWDTLYLHMNRISAGMAPGMRVAQGQEIGEVGTTGRSTGPHLHYEVHVAGQAVDPLSIETGGGRTLSGSALAAFRKLRDRADAARAATG